MFKPEKMDEIHIIGLRKNKEDILKILQELGTIQLKKGTTTDLNETPQELIHDAVLSLEQIKDIKKVLNLKQSIFKKNRETITITESEDSAFKTTSKIYLNRIHKNAKIILESKKNIDSLKKSAEKQLNLLYHFKDLHLKQNTLGDNKKTISSIGVIATKKLQKIKNTCDIKIIDETEDKTYFLFIAKKDTWNSIKNYIEMPEINTHLTIKENIKTIEKKLDSFESEIIHNIESTKLIQKEKYKILAYEEQWKNIKTRISKEKHLNRTEKTFILNGWIPTKNIEKIKQIENLVVYTKKSKETPPIKLNNPKFARPYEQITQWFGLPHYKKLDPTIFIAIMFPLFFAIMLTDAGYGFILLIASLFLYLKTDNENLKALSYIISISSVATIIVGLFFGSIFGELFGFVSVFDALRDPITILKISLAIGLVHINFGLTLNLYQQIQAKSKLILEPLSWILLEVGVILILTATGHLKIIGYIFMLITIIYKAKDGLVGILSIPSFFGSWISYIRLMALAVATSWLQFVINMGVTAATQISIVFGILVFIIGHTFNLALNFVSAFVHSMRLHYVEFFQQFYDSGGEEFKPLKNEKKYSK